jgi:hypothetical protein
VSTQLSAGPVVFAIGDGVSGSDGLLDVLLFPCGEEVVNMANRMFRSVCGIGLTVSMVACKTTPTTSTGKHIWARDVAAEHVEVVLAAVANIANTCDAHYSITNGVVVDTGVGASRFLSSCEYKWFVTNNVVTSLDVLIVRYKSNDLAVGGFAEWEHIYRSGPETYKTYRTDRGTNWSYWFSIPITLRADVEGGAEFMGYASLYLVQRMNVLARLEVRHRNARPAEVFIATTNCLLGATRR